jgi:mono/diheme cytochrome c family protein
MTIDRLALALGILALAAPSALADDIDKGRALIEANCARCHATGLQGASPLAKAPPFRDIVTRYEPETLAEALAEGIVTGHEDMPEFQFAPEEVGAVIAYLNSLKEN